MIEPHKFVKWDAGEKIEIKEPEKFLEKIYSEKFSFGIHNLKSYAEYRVNGWAYDLKPYLKRYLYKHYGIWMEAYAPSRTLLRKSTHGRITEIIEAKK